MLNLGGDFLHVFCYKANSWTYHLIMSKNERHGNISKNGRLHLEAVHFLSLLTQQAHIWTGLKNKSIFSHIE